MLSSLILRRALFLVPLLAGACATDEAPPPSTIPILTLMVDVVTPATTTLFGVDQPATDADWQALADAADVTLRAFRQVKAGGTGPNDMEWVADPRWQSHADAEIAAIDAVRRAIDRRDLDALRAANASLYAPCEACHIAFNPGVGPDAS